ncbi:MAG: DNA topoisomerase III [Ruminococcaceae bacterium]|nr:DNA topoisomerase III [Oscillospiraceae bacterium]
MILIIAEKPSLARNIVAGIGQMKRNNGYFEGLGYIVTWAFGHLFSLCDIEDYTGATSSGRWSMENIPCFPEKFRFRLKNGEDKKPDAGIIKQFELIKTLCNRSDVDTIVNAGDADREGEIIVRLCVQNALNEEKPFKRLWLPDQTPETVAEALKDMKNESEYDLLANEGFARTYIDWLYGVNLTRYASLRTGVLLRVGRVIVPVVKAIYDRDMAIRNFVPDKYFALVSSAETNGETVELVSKHKFPKEKAALAQRACDKLNAQEALVTAKKTKKDKLNPGKLYSLSKLQNFLGKKYKMNMDTSLRIVQKLYEEGFLTYPRTNSEYLATAEKDKIKKIIEIVKGKGYPVEFKDKKTIFDDSKIESHSALTPTYKFPQPGQLSDEEKTVYSAVLRRFVAVFCSEECVVQKTEITVSVGECEDYNLKGLMILEPGWTKYDEAGKNNKILPNLEKGDRVNIDFRLKEKETSPPKHYTIETLNNYLKNPFREEKAAADDSDDAEDYRAIFEGLELGTEATRTGIIDNAVKSKYIELKKDVYKILPDGEYLIEQLSNMGISMDKYKTSELGQALKKVYHGEISIDDSVLQAVNEIKGVFSAPENSPDSDRYFGFAGDEIGVCPVCGKTVSRGKYGYQCDGYKEGCKFRIYGMMSKRVITPSHAKQLLSEGKTEKIDGFISKNGKSFAACIKLQDNKPVFVFDD